MLHLKTARALLAGAMLLAAAAHAPALAEPCADREDVVRVGVTIGEDTATLGIASASIAESPVGPAVEIVICEEDAGRLATLTSANVGQEMVMRLEDQVITNGVITEPIMGGAVLIRGSFTPTEAADLAAELATAGR